jgi:hypothetical protein
VQIQLKQKASVSDVSRNLADIQLMIEQKQSIDDIARLVEDKVSR